MLAFNELPSEIHLAITNFLSPKEVCSLISTCHFFYNHDAILWGLSKRLVSPQIVAAGHSTFLLNEVGDVYVCGRNWFGELGLDHTKNNIGQFTQIPKVHHVQKIISNGNHTFFIKTDGSVWAFGHNTHGQLGLGNTTDQSIPVRVPLNSVKDIAVNLCATKFLMHDGTVLTCGLHSAKELGLGDQAIDTSEPTAIKDLCGVKEIYAGNYHTVIVKDNSIWTFGSNKTGQLGLGSIDIQACFKPTKIDVSDIQQIAVKANQTFMIKTDGSVLACGTNYHGGLGLDIRTGFTSLTPNTRLEQILKIVPGEYHTFFVGKEVIQSCGENNFNKRGTQTDSLSLAELKLPKEITACTQISAGEEHTLILTDDHQVWGLGSSKEGQLGIGTGIVNATPTEPIFLLQLPRPISTLINKLKKLSHSEEDIQAENENLLFSQRK